MSGWNRRRKHELHVKNKTLKQKIRGLVLSVLNPMKRYISARINIMTTIEQLQLENSTLTKHVKRLQDQAEFSRSRIDRLNTFMNEERTK